MRTSGEAGNCWADIRWTAEPDFGALWVMSVVSKITAGVGGLHHA
jgi:hypothetical protein